MTPPLWIALIVAGGTGAVLRLLVDRAVTRLWGAQFPFGTVLVNISGSLALGVIAAGALPGPLAPVVGVGLIGAYTTFSSWILQSYELAAADRARLAVLNIVIPAGAGLAAAALGYWLGTLL